jgi:hypothetical protein
MKLPEYVTAAEVKRVCKELGIRDWSRMRKPDVKPEEALVILSKLNTKGMDVDLEQFRKGLEVELEHGTMFREANVTNNHPILTGKIVLAHFRESLYYYMRLDVAELEGDLLKAILKKDMKKVRALYRRLADARADLGRSEAAEL